MFEGNQFDMVTYLIYLKELDESQKTTTIIAESHHNHFDVPVSAMFSYENFKSMKLKLSATTEIEKFASIAITSDSKGRNIICNKYKGEYEEQEEIHSNHIYIHYPFREPKIVAFGEKDKGKLGMSGSDATEEPTRISGNNETIVNLHQFENYSVYLDQNGKVFHTGEMPNLSTYSDFTELDIKKLVAPDDKIAGDVKDKIIKLTASTNNISVLTQKGKIWILGDNTAYQINDQGDQSAFVFKKMPGGEEEKCIDIAQGK